MWLWLKQLLDEISTNDFQSVLKSYYSCLVAQSCPTLHNSMDCNMPGLPVPHHLSEFAQVHVHCTGDAIQPFHLLSPSSLPAFYLSQHQDLFQWVCSLYQVAKVLELQLQHQSFQRVFRVDFPKGWLIWSPCLRVKPINNHIFLYMLLRNEILGLLMLLFERANHWK